MIRGGKALLLGAVLWSVLGCLAFAGTASATGCDVYASPSGSAGASGTLANPVRSLAGLDAALAPGQTGCLEAGSYGGISVDSELDASGTTSAPITITAAPGASVTVTGLIRINGSHTTLSGLNIDGSNNLYATERSGTHCPYPVSNGLEINGQGDIFENNNLYQSVASLRGNGIGVGWNGQADNTIIRDNRIHDLGQCMAYDQMIYLAHATGAQIYDNWLWNDPHGWGVQLYPAAAGAHVYDNVIDHAGSGFVIGGSTTVANNTIDHNIVLNSTGLPDAGLPQGVGISTCCGLGPNNTFTNNDIYTNPGGISAASGITLTNNTTTNPQLANPQTNDYRPTTTLPGYTLWDGNLGAVHLRTSRVRRTMAHISVAAKTVSSRKHLKRDVAKKKKRSAHKRTTTHGHRHTQTRRRRHHRVKPHVHRSRSSLAHAAS
jgi:hypothetical protein